MPATLNEEQRHLDETARRLADELAVSGPETLTSDPASGWGRISDLGWPEMRVRDESGAPLTGGVEVALIAEALAGRLTEIPFVTCGVLPVELAELAGAGDALTGETGTLALTGSLEAIAGPTGGVALDPAVATRFLALGEGEGERPLLLGELRGEPIVVADLTRSGVRLDPAAVGEAEPIGSIGSTQLSKWTALALVAIAADQLGIMERAQRLAVEYAKERRQFDVPIGTFQAVSHRCADIHVRCEAARSAVWFAAWCVDEFDPAEALRTARVAKAYCARWGPGVVEAATQVLGGIGVTWENEAHLLLRRLQLDRHLLGDERHQHAAIRASLIGG
jgi:alkylation response protein AidB-like acyl-CoA dehydrogenase